MSLSKSLVGGSTNVCKRRVLDFLQTERVLQGLSIIKALSVCIICYFLTDPLTAWCYLLGNGYSCVPKARTRMVLSEKPNDGTVSMLIGEIEEVEYTNVEEHLPTLPNTVSVVHNFCLYEPDSTNFLLLVSTHLNQVGWDSEARYSELNF